MIAMNMNKTIIAKCKMCDENHTIMVNADDYYTWKNGTGFIQDVLYYLTPGERELLISGTCGRCFDLLFEADSV